MVSDLRGFSSLVSHSINSNNSNNNSSISTNNHNSHTRSTRIFSPQALEPACSAAQSPSFAGPKMRYGQGCT